MVPLLVSLSLFGLAWLLHVAWWRVRLPRRHIAALLCLFAAVAGIAALAWAVGIAGSSLKLADVPAVLALYGGAAACYVIVYTGVEQASPTLVIVRALEGARQAGCTDADLAGLITEDLFVRPRLEALELDGLVASDADGWSLTPRGRRTARIAAALGRFFGIRESA